MATNAIGTGTANFPVNVPVDERDFWRDLAARSGAKSSGDLLRRMLLRGLEAHSKRDAETLREIRRRYYGAALLALGLWIAVSGASEAMRPARACRITRTRTMRERSEA